MSVTAAMCATPVCELAGCDTRDLQYFGNVTYNFDMFATREIVLHHYKSHSRSSCPGIRRGALSEFGTPPAEAARVVGAAARTLGLAG